MTLGAARWLTGGIGCGYAVALIVHGQRITYYDALVLFVLVVVMAVCAAVETLR